MKGDGIPLTPARGPLSARKGLFAGLLARTWWPDIRLRVTLNDRRTIPANDRSVRSCKIYIMLLRAGIKSARLAPILRLILPIRVRVPQRVRAGFCDID